MKYHVYDQKTKKQIVKRYLQGERIVTLTRALWPKCKINNHRRTIYLWIYKYTTKKESNTWEKKYKFKISKVVYDLNMKKSILKRHFWGESIL